MDTFRNVINKVTDIDLSGAAQFRLNEKDVSHIWKELAIYIDKNMSQSKGVVIPGLGTFTFFQHKLKIGFEKYILIQRPIFIISEKFLQTHGLSTTKPTVTGNIPIQSVNYTYLSKVTGFDRDFIQLCTKHMLQTFNFSVMKCKRTECVFEGIGKLVVKNGVVEMIFLKEFLEGLDEARRVIQKPDTYLKEEIRNLTHSQKTLVSDLEIIDLSTNDHPYQKNFSQTDRLLESNHSSHYKSKPESQLSNQSSLEADTKNSAHSGTKCSLKRGSMVVNSARTRSHLFNKHSPIKETLLSHRSDNGKNILFGACRKACLLDENEEHSSEPCSHRTEPK